MNIFDYQICSKIDHLPIIQGDRLAYHVRDRYFLKISLFIKAFGGRSFLFLI